MGKPDVAQRLCGSLQLYISKTRQLLGRAPPLSLDEGGRLGGDLPALAMRIVCASPGS
jgi:hypothetical protein